MHCGCGSGTHLATPLAAVAGESNQAEMLRSAAQKYALLRDAEAKRSAELTHAKQECAELEVVLLRRLEQLKKERLNQIAPESDGSDPQDESTPTVRLEAEKSVRSLAHELLHFREQISKCRADLESLTTSTKIAHKSTEEHTRVKNRLMEKRNHLISHGRREMEGLEVDAAQRKKMLQQLSVLEEEGVALDATLVARREASRRAEMKVAELEDGGKRNRAQLAAHINHMTALRSQREGFQRTLASLHADIATLDAQAIVPPLPTSQHGASSQLVLLQSLLASVQGLRRQYEESTGMTTPRCTL